MKEDIIGRGLGVKPTVGKKEKFEEKWADKIIYKNYVYDMWLWIEEEIKQARTNENEYWIGRIKGSDLQTAVINELDFVKRNKQLKE